jgi:hypothetical protein
MGLFDRPKVNDGVATFVSGAQRTAMDTRYDLLTPIGLRRVAQASHVGAVKYGAMNVEKGLPVSVFLNHALAHIYAFLEGNRPEGDPSEDLGHAAWNLLWAVHSFECWPHLNDDLRQPGCQPPKAANVEAQQ